MAFKLSTGFRNASLSQRASGVAFLQGITLALVDNGASEDTITHSGDGFITAGFQPGMQLYLKGCTTAGNDTAVSAVSASAVAAGTLTIPTATVATAETFLATSTLIGLKGGAVADVLLNGTLHIFGSGQQPATADATETGIVLMKVTNASAAFVSGAGANGLLFEVTASDAKLEKLATQVWSGVGETAAGASGTVATWWRFYANTVVTGASTSAVRVDGNCSTTNGQMIMSSSTIKTGQTITVDTFKISIPAGS